MYLDLLNLKVASAEPFVRIRSAATYFHVTGQCSHTVNSERTCSAGWNTTSERLIVWNDWLGCQTLFYRQFADGIAVSTSLVRLLMEDVVPPINYEALSVFIRLGYFLNEDTPFTGICSLPPGGNLRFDSRGISISSSGYVIPPKSALTRVGAINEYIRLFRNAIRRTYSGEEFIVPLSGGRDSRHILLECLASGLTPVECVTLHHLPPRVDHDLELAMRLTARAQVPHTILRQSADRIRVEAVNHIATQFCADEHAWYTPLADYLRRAPRRLIYSGLGGDTFSESGRHTPAQTDLAAHGDFSGLAEELLGTEDRPDLDEVHARLLLNADLLARCTRAVAKERVAAELEHHSSAAHPMASFLFWNRVRREIALASFQILGAAAPVETPYLEENLFLFLASLPADLVVGQQLHTAVLRCAFPSYADIPFEKESDAPTPHPKGILPMGRSFGHLSRFAVDLLWLCIDHRDTHILRGPEVLKRVFSDLISGRLNAIGWYGPRLLYFLQLEAVLRVLQSPAGRELSAGYAPIGTQHTAPALGIN